MRTLSRAHAAGESHGIDLAPMLDFVMNLLIFFIITTSFVKEAGITVTRAQAETAEHQESGNILIAIRPNGDILSVTNREAIEDEAKAARAKVDRTDEGNKNKKKSR